jgi:2-keto-4-pentenoate hydratase/2-oxohepta-3-ene-1,7-dioic acid hydratase in catechol pathway
MLTFIEASNDFLGSADEIRRPRRRQRARRAIRQACGNEAAGADSGGRAEPGLVGLNYAEHAAESRITQVPEYPVYFTKPPSVRHRSGGYTVAWLRLDAIDWEVELVAVIRRRGAT